MEGMPFWVTGVMALKGALGVEFKGGGSKLLASSIYSLVKQTFIQNL